MYVCMYVRDMFLRHLPYVIFTYKMTLLMAKTMSLQIDSLCEDGQVLFVDGSSVIADSIIYCTGSVSFNPMAYFNLCNF